MVRRLVVNILASTCYNDIGVADAEWADYLDRLKAGEEIAAISAASTPSSTSRSSDDPGHRLP